MQRTEEGPQLSNALYRGAGQQNFLLAIKASQLVDHRRAHVLQLLRFIDNDTIIPPGGLGQFVQRAAAARSAGAGRLVISCEHAVTSKNDA